MRVHLISENQDYPNLHFTVSQKTIVLGRSQRADVQFLHPLLSRFHCEWLLIDGEMVLRDLESTNHTIVNGKAIKQAMLRSGDRLLLGDVHFVVEFDTEQREPSENVSEFHQFLIEPEVDDEVPTSEVSVENISTQASTD